MGQAVEKSTTVALNGIRSQAEARIRTTGKRVLVRRDRAQDQTEGGVLLPDSAKEKPQRGFVVSVGDQVRAGPENGDGPLFKKGDKVLFTAYAGNRVELEGQDRNDEYLFIDEDSILAIVE